MLLDASFNRVYTKFGEMYILWPPRDREDFMRHRKLVHGNDFNQHENT